jgi:tetratricopeptide (TPR) repeat protein
MGTSMRRPFWLFVLAVLIVSGGISGYYWLTSENTEEVLDQAHAALKNGNPSQAEQLILGILDHEPDNVPALLFAGDLADQEQRWQDAVEYYERLPLDQDLAIVNAGVRAAEILLFQLHQASKAERKFREVLDVAPSHAKANFYLVGLLAVTGRAREATPLVLELIRQDLVSKDHLFRRDLVSKEHLMLLHNNWGGLRNPELLYLCQTEDPDDSLVLLGQARLTGSSKQSADAIALLQQAIRQTPELMEAQIRLGALLAKQDSAEEFQNWHSKLSAECDEWPRLWSVRGTWAERNNRPRVAMRCYWEALRRNPGLTSVNYRLGLLLQSHFDAKTAKPFLDSARKLQSIRPQESLLVYQQTGSLERLQEIASEMESLGRLREAWGWCRVIQQYSPDNEWARKRIDHLEPQIRDTDPQLQFTVNLASSIDLSNEPLPEWNTLGSLPENKLVATTEPAISFQDDAQSAGLSFEWHHTGRSKTHGLRMFEFTGGGVAITDYDGDAWPDIYFTQSRVQPFGDSESGHVDKLFRNCGDGHFEEITLLSGIDEDRFSQGVAVGDFDSDGFADLYVGNIGANRLYHNNGDGTFAEHPLPPDADEHRWTTSCLMSDLNGDGLPDLYDVNYLEGADIFERVCRHADGSPLLCLPSFFSAAQDRVLLNTGNGGFQEVTADAGFVCPDGKGLGIVLADFRGLLKPELFIANDAVANFFFTPSAESEEDMQYVEQALPAGLALNSSGLPEGCMGVAAGDVNGDGRLDLFVTNFFRESNTLYMNQPDGTFVDATLESGLAEASKPMLGFGTQFLDANLDGWLDAIVANGHVFDLTQRSGTHYHMRPQFFVNLHGGRFVEYDASRAGPYFEQRHLGRGLARLDWNRDGREDVVVSHLDEPATLLTNTTETTGHYLAIELHGVISDRDAVRSSVTVRTRQRELVRQVTAGDGYQASNQRLLVFGLGDEQTADEVEIIWPSGDRQRFVNLRADSHYVVIENRNKAFNLRRDM